MNWIDVFVGSSAVKSRTIIPFAPGIGGFLQHQIVDHLNIGWRLLRGEPMRVSHL
jgi:hypothetical protein